jgi:hypothetical protein
MTIAAAPDKSNILPREEFAAVLRNLCVKGESKELGEAVEKFCQGLSFDPEMERP